MFRTTIFDVFFDMLQMQTVFTWRMQSSHFFLTLNMLAGSSDDLTIEKYSALTEMIFSQLAAKDTVESDPSKGSACILFDSSGLRVNNGYRVGDKTYKVGRQVWAFASSLNWLSLRTAFYSLAAHSSGMEAVLHPIRHAFRLHLARRMLGMPTTTFEPLVSMLRDGIALTVREIVQAADPIINRMDLPIFTAYIATRTKNPHDFITEAHRLRGEAPIVEARRRLIDLEDLVEHGDRRSFVIEVNRLQREIEQAAQRLRAAYGVDTPQGVPVSTITSILNIPLQFKTGITLPDFGWKIPLPSRLSRLADRRGFKAVFRSVVDDLVSVERLGVLHEVIASAVVYEEHAAYYEQKQEDARYRGWNSGVKQWM